MICEGEKFKNVKLFNVQQSKLGNTEYKYKSFASFFCISKMKNDNNNSVTAAMQLL